MDSRHTLTAATLAGHGDQRAPGLIEMRGVGKTFVRGQTAVEAVRGVDLCIQRGEFVSVIGQSGCGKSTLLNMLAGLMEPSDGTLLFDGAPVPKPNTNVGYITQKDNLMPWRTVAKNVCIALEIAGVGQQELRRRTREVLELVGLDGFEDAYPNELSGGMKKRASLARTLIYDPEVILADEPFGALDAQLKLVMQAELLRIWQEAGGDRTVVFVTHDVMEAVTLADRVIVFTPRPGRVKLDRTIDIPRPRDVFKVRFTPQFSAIHEELWDALGVIER